MKKKVIVRTLLATSMIFITGKSFAEEFKRFSVSAGWLHMTSLGKAQSFRNTTSVKEKTLSKVGMISGKTVAANVDQSREKDMDPELYNLIMMKSYPDDPNNDRYMLDELLDLAGGTDDPDSFIEYATGTAEVNGLSAWSSNAGVEVKDVDTLGLMFTYNLNENVSLQMVGGIPPKVTLKGKGQIYAPFSASAQPLGGLGGDLYLKNNILITDLSQYSKAATARAWTPGIQAQYYFGKPGVNKFRPFLGGGLMYAHFSDVKLNAGIKSDLVIAGHMVQNIHDNKAGASLEGKPSSGDMHVKVKADDALAPMVTAGFTYDFKPNWFTTASISYAKLDNTATVTVVNNNNGAELIRAKTKIDIQPLISYFGIGYRF